MVRTLIKGYPAKDTVSISNFHVKEEIWVRIPAVGPSYVGMSERLCAGLQNQLARLDS